jgi:D-glycero-D-manno-heptose 1,7-bisphosphate phosphatase
MKVAFLDRDGVINKDTEYLYKIDDFEFTSDCVVGLKRLIDKGYLLIIVTNQSGIGRGYYSEQDYQALTTWYLDELLMQGVSIQAVYHCPHSPEFGCDCRKPKSGLFRQALKQYPEIDLSQSLMIGDKLSDLKAANSVGVQRLVLVESENKKDAYNASSELDTRLERFISLADFSCSL